MIALKNSYAEDLTRYTRAELDEARHRAEIFGHLDDFTTIVREQLRRAAQED